MRMIPDLVRSGSIISDDQDKSNLFGDILEKVYNPSEIYDESFKSDICSQVSNFLSSPQDSSFQSFSDIELSKVISDLKFSAAGDDGINNLMIKHSSPSFKSLLLTLFNNIVLTGSIPDPWKFSLINMIPKKLGFSSDPNEYRPISLTSCLSKVFEKLVFNRIYDFLEKK